jgi:hypothetical protein
VHIKPNKSEAYCVRGLAYTNWGKAIVDYTEAIKFDPTLVEAYRCRGIALDKATKRIHHNKSVSRLFV